MALNTQVPLNHTRDFSEVHNHPMITMTIEGV